MLARQLPVNGDAEGLGEQMREAEVAVVLAVVAVGALHDRLGDRPVPAVVRRDDRILLARLLIALDGDGADLVAVGLQQREERQRRIEVLLVLRPQREVAGNRVEATLRVIAQIEPRLGAGQREIVVLAHDALVLFVGDRELQRQLVGPLRSSDDDGILAGDALQREHLVGLKRERERRQGDGLEQLVVRAQAERMAVESRQLKELFHDLLDVIADVFDDFARERLGRTFRARTE